ncbi:MAG: restriction endonuclease subunit S, partial [Candidatus Micrarchaeaceae archaeon]
IGAPGDILLSHKGTVGKIALVSANAPPFVCSPQTTFWRTQNERILDRKYLYAFLRSPVFHAQLATRAGETDMAPYVSLTSQRGLSVTLPPIVEQRAIAQILGSLDERIEVNRQMSETLEAMVRALFKSWFVDFDPVRAKAEGCDPGLPREISDLFSSRLVESEIGEIPEGWALRALGDVSQYLSRGISPVYIDSGGVLVLNQKCVRNNRVDLNKGRRHDSTKRAVDGRSISIGDILVNSTGVGTLGRAAQILTLDENTIVDSHVTVVRVDDSRLSWNYLGLNLLRRQNEIEALGEGSTGQTELARTRLAMLPVLVPARELITLFDRFTLPLRKAVANSDNESRTRAALRDALLPKFISGELRVKDAKSFVEHAA